jgi:2-polyprenyl-6-methoxyphenol hydroxylase-like FAD-dependent oxidoreductase
MKFDIIVIGSGPGGYFAAIRTAQLGLKAAVGARASRRNLPQLGVYSDKGASAFRGGLRVDASRAGLWPCRRQCQVRRGAVIKRSRDVAGRLSRLGRSPADCPGPNSVAAPARHRTGQARDSREARWLPATIQLTFEPNDRRLIVDRGHRIQSSFCQGYERPLTDTYKLPS